MTSTSDAAFMATALRPERAQRTFPHIFIIHTHGQAKRVARLAHRLLDSSPDCFVLISHDCNAVPMPSELFRHPSIAVISGLGGRADFTIVDGYLAALAWLDVQQIEYSWVSNLSGQDYPVRPPGAFEDSIARADGVDGFIHHFPALEVDSAAMAPWTWPQGEGQLRYCFRYRRLKSSLSRSQRALVWPLRTAFERLDLRWRICPSYGLMLGTRQDEKPWGPDFRIHAGSFWHTLNRRCVRALVDFVDRHPDIVAHFRSLLQPEEAFVQTVLVNTPALCLVNDDLRYIDMRGSKHGRPKLLTQDDLPGILASGKAFARKFGDDAEPLLDRIDLILGKTEVVFRKPCDA